MRKAFVVGYTPKKRIFGGYSEEERKLFDIANRFLTARGVPVGTVVNVEFVEGHLIITRRGNFLNI